MKTATREDYELAAKAAGISIATFIPERNICFLQKDGRPSSESWNPLTDDGDSRRLEVAINCDAMRLPDFVNYFKDYSGKIIYYADHNNDKCEAARFAVFFLAVNIGKGMK